MIQDGEKPNLIQSKHLKYTLSKTGLYPFLSEIILQKLPADCTISNLFIATYLLTN